MREDWPGLVDSVDGAGSTNRTANASGVPHTRLLLLGRDQATTKWTHRKLALVFLAELCAPVIYQVFARERFAAVGATRCYRLAKTVRVIRGSLVQVEAGIAYRFMAGSAKEMLRVPGGS